MRYVALLLLFLLSLYFLALKPYLTAKRIHYNVEGLSLSLFPLSLRIGKFYLYFPMGKLYINLSLSDFLLSYKDIPTLKLREGHLIIIEREKKEEEKRRTPANIVLPQFLKSVQAEVGRFYLTLQNGETFVELHDLTLRDGGIKGYALLHRGNNLIKVEVRRARLLKDSIRISDAEVSSELFSFKIKGSLKDTQEALFSVEGSLKRIDTPYASISPIRIKGEGRATYSGLDMELRATADTVLIKERKLYREVRASGTLSYSFGGELLMRGRLWNEDVLADYRLELFHRNRLRLRVERFPLDSELLRTEVFLLAWLRGELVLDFDRKLLSIYAGTDGIGVEGIGFGKTQGWVRYDYSSGKGEVELALWGGDLFLSGGFERESFESRVSIKDLLLPMNGITLFLSYRGKLSYRGELSAEGKGRIEDLFYRDFPVGGADYRLSLKGRGIDLSYRGEGFSGYLRGSADSFISINRIESFVRMYRDAEIRVDEATLELAKDRDILSVASKIDRASVARGDVRIPLTGKAEIRIGKELEGSFILRAEEVKLSERLSLKGAFLKGSISDGKLAGSYGTEKLLKGIYSLDMHEFKLSTKGRFEGEELWVDYSFSGSPKEGKGRALLRYSLGGEEIKLRTSVSYKGENIRLKVEPTSLHYGVAEIGFGGAELSGTREIGRVSFGKVSLLVLGTPFAELLQEEGSYNLKEGRFSLRFRSQGAVSGSLELGFERESGFSVRSEGLLDMDRLSFFVATPAGGRLEGKLGFKLTYVKGKLKLVLKNRGRVVTYSRFFTYPMDAWIELRALGRSLSAFFTLWKDNSGLSANVGSLDLKNYYVYLVSRDLPISYRRQDLSLNLEVSSEGWVRVKELKRVLLKLNMLLSGEIEIRKAERKTGREGKAPELELDVRFSSSAPIRVKLPEGYLYVKVNGWVGGKSSDPEYAVSVEFLSGELTYFGRKFFVRGGRAELLKEKEGEEKRIDLSLVNPSEDMSIFINLRGELDNPDIVVWSEPPRSTQEILTKLIIGSTAEGVIPVAKTLFKQLGYLGSFKSGLASLLGVDITLSTQTGAQGEIGVSVNIRKKIARAFTIEYQQSTLKDPRQTYYGGGVSLPAGMSFYGRVFADNTSEIKLKFIRKFDF